MKLKQIRIAKGRQQKELAIKIGTDEPMMSKFENYKCLPVPSMMKRLTEELGVSVDDIYEPHEVYYQGARAKASAPKKKAEEEVYHLTVNLPPEAREFFKTALKKCGFKDITAWVSATHIMARLRDKLRLWRTTRIARETLRFKPQSRTLVVTPTSILNFLKWRRLSLFSNPTEAL